MAWADKMPLKKGIFLLSIQPHTFRICWTRDNASIQRPERAEEAIHYLFTLSANSDQLLQSPALSFFIKQKAMSLQLRERQLHLSG